MTGSDRSRRRPRAGVRWAAATAVAACSAVACLAGACGRDGPAPAPEPAPSATQPPAPPADPARDRADAEGVALMIVYDTSGSMKEDVRNAKGVNEAKRFIARRAFDRIVGRLDAWVAAAPPAAEPAPGAPAAPPPAPRRLDVGIVVFDGGSVVTLLPLRPFDAAALRARVDSLHPPDSHTPLGDAVRAAGDAVLASKRSRRHVLVLTDGENTVGPRPEQTMPGLLERAKRADASVSVHFVAFDVNAAVFEKVKELGATVLGASDENQLDERLRFILERKILLEEPEPGAPAAPGAK